MPKELVFYIEDIRIDAVFKKIKNIHLKVLPSGSVRISAPLRTGPEAAKAFAASKIGWIRKHREDFLNRAVEPPPAYSSGENHYFLGRRYLLRINEHNAAPRVELDGETLEIRLRPDAGPEKRRSVLEEWYRGRLKEILPGIISHYEEITGVRINEFGVKKMKTRWGTCNVRAKRIWLNLELAKKSRRHIEYIVAHEMTHLLERSHNARFKSYLETLMPDWRSRKKELNLSGLVYDTLPGNY